MLRTPLLVSRLTCVAHRWMDVAGGAPDAARPDGTHNATRAGLPTSVDVGDFVIWDNRATMHRGKPFADTQYRRELRRVTTLTRAGPDGGYCMSADRPYAALKVQLAAGRMVLIDGGTGTELEHRGAEMVSDAGAMATLRPRRHCGRSTVTTSARASVITINTFSTNRNMLDPAGLGHHFEEANRRAAEVALEARALENAERTVAIAGSMSHQMLVNPE